MTQNIQDYEIHLQGNIVDHSWYHIFQKKGKIQTNAIMLLSDIVYWYSPTIIRDEGGLPNRYEKKFKADILQRSYGQIENLIGLTKDQARDALEFLEEMKIVKREMRTIEIRGRNVSNIMYINFYPENLKKLMLDYKKLMIEEKGKEGGLKKFVPLSEKTDKHVGKNRRIQETITETSKKNDIVREKKQDLPEAPLHRSSSLQDSIVSFDPSTYEFPGGTRISARMQNAIKK